MPKITIVLEQHEVEAACIEWVRRQHPALTERKYMKARYTQGLDGQSVPNVHATVDITDPGPTNFGSKD